MLSGIAMLSGIEDIYSGIVYDALRLLGLKDGEFLLNSAIRPLDKTSVIWGPAFTTKGRVVGPTNYEEWDKIRLDIYNNVNYGDIIILEANEHTVAHSGDITSLLYKMHGATGFVTEGIVRDSQKIIEMNFPCFCTHTNPVDAIDYWAITDFNTPVELPAYTMNKITISPGDYIFGDADGVLVIKKELLEDFIQTLQEVSHKEQTIRGLILSHKNIKDIYKDMGRW